MLMYRGYTLLQIVLMVSTTNHCKHPMHHQGQMVSTYMCPLLVRQIASDTLLHHMMNDQNPDYV